MSELTIMSKKTEGENESTSNDGGESRLASHRSSPVGVTQRIAKGQRATAQLLENSKLMPDDPPLVPAPPHCKPPSNLEITQMTELGSLQSMPVNNFTLIYKQDRPTFTKEEMDLIRLGLVPNQMNDQWVMVYVPRKLCIHHALSGLCLYEVGFHPTSTGYAVGKITFNCSFDGSFSEVAPIDLIKRYLLSSGSRDC